MARIRKLLIANRGEIAVRVAAACRERGVVPVAVFSDADAGAPHVRACAEAVRLGPAPARESYLSIDAVIGAARAAGADAVHPGYGFLSEQPAFAEAVAAAGLVYVGPPADAQRKMGSKAAARAAMRAAGVPVVPGYEGEDDSIERLRAEAGALGFPLLVKAVAGGGGKGLRRVERVEELDRAVESCRREAQSAFGSSRVLLERLLVRPRHIEVQVLCDAHGAVVWLGERECSVQRRHQKIVEEAPSPVVAPELRARMGEAAVRAARAAGYVNAGTVEMLYEEERSSFYFLEMNTRLQVEHPITELVYGLDLVHAQLRVAEGEPLWLAQEDVRARGWAIECRLYAEDPERGFLPSPGRITRWRAPGGPGVRVDHAVESGLEVGVYYDPLLAKVVVWAETRDAARARMARALADTVLEGITTNLPFLRDVVAHEDFAAGKVDTGWVEARLAGWRAPADADAEAPADVAPAVVPDAPVSPWQTLGAWRLGSGPGTAAAGTGTAAPRAPAKPRAKRIDGDLSAPMPGRVLVVDVALGDAVQAGQRLAVIEAMKMEHPLRAPHAGTVRAILCAAGQMVDPGKPLFEIAPAPPG
jgi:acetyl-CoA carboxylase biotin carboxylase subunit